MGSGVIEAKHIRNSGETDFGVFAKSVFSFGDRKNHQLSWWFFLSLSKTYAFKIRKTVMKTG